jgi:riboflavin synthase
MAKIGLCDTTFARLDLARFVMETLHSTGQEFSIERYTVPGVKDLPVAAKKLIDEHGCDIVIALGMPGAEKIDKQCAHEASLGLIQAQLLSNRHILEVFVHADEASSPKELYRIARERAAKHTLNAIALLEDKTALAKSAGRGLRQGKDDEGPLLE